jgi:hypothetical protein
MAMSGKGRGRMRSAKLEQFNAYCSSFNLFANVVGDMGKVYAIGLFGPSCKPAAGRCRRIHKKVTGGVFTRCHLEEKVKLPI